MPAPNSETLALREALPALRALPLGLAPTGVASRAAGCLRMRQSWTEAQHTPAGWKPQRKEARPYFLALTSHSQAVQKTNSLDSLIAFHEGQSPDAK